MRWLIFFFIYTNFVLANSFNVAIERPEEFIDNLLNASWSEIPKQFTISNQHLSPINSNISANLVKATFTTSNENIALFSIKILNKNQSELIWNLDQFKLNSLIKLRFKFSMYGVKITHDEYFKIEAKKIANATTSLKFNLNQNQIQLDQIQNEKFEFENVQIKPKNGVGTILKYIFENIFSKSKVEKYLTYETNKILNNWMNNNILIENINGKLNKALTAFQSNPFPIEHNNLFFILKNFSLDPEFLNFNLNTKIEPQKLKVHLCANDLVTKSNVQIDYSIIEKLINNLITFESWQDQVLLEPLLCFGYKHFDQNGNPTGEEAQFEIIGKNVSFNYWISPTSYPTYTYLPENNKVRLEVNLKLKINNSHYPLLRSVDEYINLKSNFIFSFNYDFSNGIFLKMDTITIDQLIGQLKIKPFKLSPWISLPMDKVKNELEKSINKSLSSSVVNVKILNSIFNLNKHLELKINDFKLNTDSYHLFFSWQKVSD